MKLPEKDCYTLEEVARRWQCEVSEVHHYIVMDLLIPSIYVDQPVWAVYFKLTVDPETGNESVVPRKNWRDLYNRASGLFYLWGYRTGPMQKRFTLFYSGKKHSPPFHDTYTPETVKDKSLPQLYRVADLKDLGPDGDVPMDRLVIVPEEIERFEAQYRNATAENQAQPSQEEKPLTTNERNTLLVLIAALCTKAGIDPQARGAAGQLVTLASVEKGVPLDPGTVLDKLKQIADAVGARQR